MKLLKKDKTPSKKVQMQIQELVKTKLDLSNIHKDLVPFVVKELKKQIQEL